MCYNFARQKKSTLAAKLLECAFILQVKNPVSDFLSSTLVPELSSQVATSSSADRERVMVTVSASRTFPVKMTMFVLDNLNFTIKATGLAVV